MAWGRVGPLFGVSAFGGERGCIWLDGILIPVPSVAKKASTDTLLSTH